jgi:hypothetical protein
MDFIEHLRRIQADEPSSDEESGLTLTSLSASGRSRRSSSTDSTVITVPDQPDEETKVSSAKSKRDYDTAHVGEDVAAAPRPAKKAKTSLSDAEEERASPERKSNGHSTVVPAAQAGLLLFGGIRLYGCLSDWSTRARPVTGTLASPCL